MTEPDGRADGPDLLVAGADEPPWSLGRRRTVPLVAVVGGLALLAGGLQLASQQRAADRQARAEAAAADALEIALGDRSRLPRHGARPQGIYVELVNAGPRDVQLLSIELGPDREWAVLPDPAGRLLANGSVLLQLLVPCAEDDPVGEGVGRLPVPDPQADPPRTLELTALLDSGRTASTALHLVDAPLAYGGDLDQELRGVIPDPSAPGPATAGSAAPCA